MNEVYFKILIFLKKINYRREKIINLCFLDIINSLNKNDSNYFSLLPKANNYHCSKNSIKVKENIFIFQIILKVYIIIKTKIIICKIQVWN